MYRLKVDNPDKLFFTSDTHFSHFAIAKYCHRPFGSCDEMNQQLIDNWNSVIPEDAVVIHCGDFMNHKFNIDDYLEMMQKLNGRILLVRGNHDIVDIDMEGKNNLITVVDKAIIDVDGVRIYAEHYPCYAFNGDYQVFGHIHTLKDGTCYGIDGDPAKVLRHNQYDVGVDNNDYKPVSYWQLCDKIRQKAIK